MYRISRNSRSSSCFLSGVGIAEAVAVFPVAIPIANEFLSTVLASESVEGLLLYLVLVAVPVGHAAFVRAVFLFLPSWVLRNRLSAVMAEGLTQLERMPLQMGFNGVG